MKKCYLLGSSAASHFHTLLPQQNAKRLQKPPLPPSPICFALGTIQHVSVQISQVSEFLIKVRKV